MSFADAMDLCDIYEATGRTVKRTQWVDEIREAVEADRQSAMIDAMV